MGRVAGAVRVDLRLLEQEEDERQAKLKALRRAAKEGFDEIDQRPEETWRSTKRSKCPVKLMLRVGMIVSFRWNSTAIGNLLPTSITPAGERAEPISRMQRT